MLVELRRDSRRRAAPPDRGLAARRDPAGRLPRGALAAADRGASPPTSASPAASSSRPTSSSSAEGYLTSRAGGYTRVADRPRAGGAAGAAGAGRRAGDRLLPLPRRRLELPARRVAALDAPRAHARSPTSSSATSAPAASRAAPGARRVPQPRARHVGEPGAHRRSAPATPRASRLVIDVLVRSGAKRLARRGPVRGRRRACRSRARPGSRSSACRSTSDGIRVDALDRLEADALVLTPSHQWPTGAVLSADAPRSAVLRWARSARRADHRGRLRRRVPLRPRADRSHAGPRPRPRRLRGHREQDARARAPARLARGARPTSSTRSPRRRCWPTAARPCSTSWPSPTSWPAASSTATCGGCARSTGAGATRCSPPCGEQLPELEPAGIAAGLHLVAYLPDDLDEAAVVEAAAARGVAVDGLAPYRIVRRRAAPGSSSATRRSASTRSPRASGSWPRRSGSRGRPSRGAGRPP